jgi:hypothetical protein
MDKVSFAVYERKNVGAKKALLGHIFFLGLDIFVKLSTDMQDTNMYIDKKFSFHTL